MAKGAKSDRVPEHPPAVEEDLYKILGVESDATPEAIKTAYKKNALKHHPGMFSFRIHPYNSRRTTLLKHRKRQGERGCPR